MNTALESAWHARLGLHPIAAYKAGVVENSSHRKIIPTRSITG